METDYLSHNGSWWTGWESARTVAQGVRAFLVGGCHVIDAIKTHEIAFAAIESQRSGQAVGLPLVEPADT